MVPAFLARTTGRLRLSPTLSARLDLARGVAAVAVLLNHLRALFFVEYSGVAPEHRSLATKVVYFATGFGHEAVVVFFVLSGLLISWSVVRSAAAGRWSWRWYAEQRLTRLYVVLLPALVLGALWDRAGMTLLGTAGVYGGGARNTVLTFAIVARAGLGPFLGNLLFVQEILVPPFGSNAPLWSLSYEFWYYALFPTLVLALARGTALRRAGHALAACAVLAFVGPDVRLYFAVWLLGLAATLVPPRARVSRASRGLLTAASAGFLAGTLVLCCVNWFRSGRHADAALALAFAGAVAVQVHLAEGGASRPRDVGAEPPTLAGALAGFSYSLYLVHLPPLVFLSGMWTRNGAAPWQPDAAHLALSIPLAAGVLAYAYGVAHLTEHRTDAVRRWLARALPRGGARAGGSEAGVAAGS